MTMLRIDKSPSGKSNLNRFFVHSNTAFWAQIFLRHQKLHLKYLYTFIKILKVVKIKTKIANSKKITFYLYALIYIVILVFNNLHIIK